MVKKELPLSLQTEKVPTPSILNIWPTKEGEVEFYRVQLYHNDPAADPQSPCNGSVFINFRPSDRGDKIITCQSCKKPVSVNISYVKAELNLPL